MLSKGIEVDLTVAWLDWSVPIVERISWPLLRSNVHDRETPNNRINLGNYVIVPSLRSNVGHSRNNRRHEWHLENKKWLEREVSSASRTLDFMDSFVQENLCWVLLLTDHQPVFGLFFGNKFDHHLFIITETNTIMNIGESSTAHEAAQLIIIAEVRLDHIETNHVE